MAIYRRNYQPAEPFIRVCGPIKEQPTHEGAPVTRCAPGATGTAPAEGAPTLSPPETVGRFVRPTRIKKARAPGYGTIASEIVAFLRRSPTALTPYAIVRSIDSPVRVSSIASTAEQYPNLIGRRVIGGRRGSFYWHRANEEEALAHIEASLDTWGAHGPPSADSFLAAVIRVLYSAPKLWTAAEIVSAMGTPASKSVVSHAAIAYPSVVGRFARLPRRRGYVYWHREHEDAAVAEILPR